MDKDLVIQYIKDMKLNSNQNALFHEHLQQVSLALETIISKIVTNPKFCVRCALRKYIDLALQWDRVLEMSDAIESSDSYSLYGLSLEFLTATHFTKLAQNHIEFIQSVGVEKVKALGIKDPNIDITRLYGLMMDVFIAVSSKKIIDILIKLVYDMQVDNKHISFIMSFFLERIMVSVGHYTHYFQDDTLSGYVLIRKLLTNDSRGLSSDEPLIFKYNIEKRE